MRRIFMGFAIGLVVALAAMPATAQPWNLRIVDNAGDMGYNSRIAVTSDGTPYILYVSGWSTSSMYLAWWVSSGPGSGGWDRIYVADSDFSSYPTTALVADSNDNLHIAYIYYGTMSYALFNTATKNWIIPPEAVVSSYYSSYYPAIAVIDSGGIIEPIIAYHSGGGDLYIATRDSLSGTWSSAPIYEEPGSVGRVSMAVGSTGRIYVSFYEQFGDDLMYATKAPSDTTWATGYIDITGNVGSYNSIILDENDVPHVVYYDATNGDLKYAKVVTP